jgi:hypothetical protein
MRHPNSLSKPAVQPAHAADAALRPQDRSHFEGGNQPDCLPDLQGGAAERQGVGPLKCAHIGNTLSFVALRGIL